jgi:hypothetical protein
VSLAAQKLVVQVTGEEATIPGQNQRNPPVFQILEMASKRDQVVAGLQFDNGRRSCAHCGIRES